LNKKTFGIFIKFGESFSLSSLLNESQTYQGNPCGIYPDLSSSIGSGVYLDLSSFTGKWPLPWLIFLHRKWRHPNLRSLYQTIRPVRFTSPSGFPLIDPIRGCWAGRRILVHREYVVDMLLPIMQHCIITISIILSFIALLPLTRLQAQ